ALSLYVAPRRRVVARGGEADGAVVRDRNDRLHRALAERLGAQHDRTVLVLPCAGYVFRGRGGSAVDQDDDRLAVHQVAGFGVPALRLLALAAAGRDDLALVHEIVADGNRLVEQPARIVAQVEHQALHLALGRFLELGDGLLEAAVGLFAEARDADVADVAVLQLPAHRLDRDDGALQRYA